MKRAIVAGLLVTSCFAGGCASTPRVVVNGKVPAGATVGVVSFRDCLMPDQKDDCPGSQNIAGPVYARVLRQSRVSKSSP